MRLATVFNHEELVALQTGVIVEMFPRVTAGSARRKFQAEFTEAEQERAKGIYRMSHNWHLRSGIPQELQMPFEKYEFIKRLADFCAAL